jgi:hypothetical protein
LLRRITARVTRRLEKNLPRILSTLEEQLDQDPEAEKLKATITLTLRRDTRSAALSFAADVTWRTAREFTDKDDGETVVPGQLELFPPPTAADEPRPRFTVTVAEAASDYAAADGAGAAGKRKRARKSASA